MIASSTVQTIKELLKHQGYSYGDVASYLGLSESSVKRMFSIENFSLERLEQICTLLNMDLSDLAKAVEQQQKKISQLTEAQEKVLVSDVELLLVAICVRNHLSFKQILDNYEISQTTCIQKLVILDRLKVIELLPENRIRLLISEDFHWLPNGPIELFFKKNIQNDYLDSYFVREQERYLFLSGLLASTSIARLVDRLDQLVIDFAEARKRDQDIPLKQKRNFAVLLSARYWELKAFKRYQRR